MSKRTCWVDECPVLSSKWGLCSNHAALWEQEHPRKKTAIHGSLEKKFEFYVERSTEECSTWGAQLTGCWHWGGTLSENGYGLISGPQREGSDTPSSTPIRAHRFSYETTHGPVPDGLEVDHRCRVRPCVNPAHLEAVTSQVNNLRGTSMAAVHAAKTRCPEGHEYDGSGSRGDRTCSRCIRSHSLGRNTGVGSGGYQATRTHCPERHPYEGENLIIEKRKRSDGSYGEVRKCRICVAAVRAARNARKRSS